MKTFIICFIVLLGYGVSTVLPGAIADMKQPSSVGSYCAQHNNPDVCN